MKFLLLLLLSSTAFAQYPRPYVAGGLELNGGGYAPFGAAVSAGIFLNRDHIIWDAHGAYDNGHKASTSDDPTPRGHDRSLSSALYYRRSDGWFFGPGARWSQLIGDQYSKQGWHPTVGLGKDYFSPKMSFRLQGDYILPLGSEHVDRRGCQIPNGQCTSGISGPLISFYLPSPKTKSHFLYLETVGIYRFHTTVTSTDPALTSIQRGQHEVASWASFQLIYRF